MNVKKNVIYKINAFAFMFYAVLSLLVCINVFNYKNMDMNAGLFAVVGAFVMCVTMFVVQSAKITKILYSNPIVKGTLEVISTLVFLTLACVIRVYAMGEFELDIKNEALVLACVFMAYVIARLLNKFGFITLLLLTPWPYIISTYGFTTQEIMAIVQVMGALCAMAVVLYFARRKKNIRMAVMGVIVIVAFVYLYNFATTSGYELYSGTDRLRQYYLAFSMNSIEKYYCVVCLVAAIIGGFRMLFGNGSANSVIMFVSWTFLWLTFVYGMGSDYMYMIMPLLAIVASGAFGTRPQYMDEEVVLGDNLGSVNPQKRKSNIEVEVKNDDELDKLLDDVNKKEPYNARKTYSTAQPVEQQNSAEDEIPIELQMYDSVAAKAEEEAKKAKEAEEAARIEAEKAEAERVAAEEAESARIAAQKAEEARKAAEEAEAARLALLRAEEEKAAMLKAEAERIAAQKAENARLEAEAAARQAELERLATERLAAEAAVEKAKAERLAAEAAAEAAKAERIAAEKAEAERKAAEEAARIEAERKAAEEAARIEAERKAAEEAARIEAERKAAEEAEAARIAEEERKAAEEAARIEAERKAAEEEAARIAEEERKAAEEAARLEEERLAAEEAARIEAERLAAEVAAQEAARIEAARLAAEEEAARIEAERLAAEEEAARIEAERLAAEEEAARIAEEERLAAEEAARIEAERKAAEEAERIEAERLAAEAAAEEAARRAEEERLAAEEAARIAEEERLAAEEAARIAEEERLAAEEAARIEAERLAAEEEAARIAEEERLAAEKAARIEAERIAAEEAAAEAARIAEEERLAAEEAAAEAARIAEEERIALKEAEHISTLSDVLDFDMPAFETNEMPTPYEYDDTEFEAGSMMDETMNQMSEYNVASSTVKEETVAQAVEQSKPEEQSSYRNRGFSFIKSKPMFETMANFFTKEDKKQNISESKEQETGTVNISSDVESTTSVFDNSYEMQSSTRNDEFYEESAPQMIIEPEEVDLGIDLGEEFDFGQTQSFTDFYDSGDTTSFFDNVEEVAYEESEMVEAEMTYEELEMSEAEMTYEEPEMTEVEMTYEEPEMTEAEMSYEEPEMTEAKMSYEEPETSGDVYVYDETEEEEKEEPVKVNPFANDADFFDWSSVDESAYDDEPEEVTSEQPEKPVSNGGFEEFVWTDDMIKGLETEGAETTVVAEIAATAIDEYSYDELAMEGAYEEAGTVDEDYIPTVADQGYEMPDDTSEFSVYQQTTSNLSDLEEAIVEEVPEYEVFQSSGNFTVEEPVVEVDEAQFEVFQSSGNVELDAVEEIVPDIKTYGSEDVQETVSTNKKFDEFEFDLDLPDFEPTKKF